jgi:hypothetical protein
MRVSPIAAVPLMLTVPVSFGVDGSESRQAVMAKPIMRTANKK